MARIGYLRVSKEEQRPDRQIDGLDSLCDKLYIEKVSAVAKKRPIFNQIIKDLKKGDTLIVWDLDRAFRNTIDALTIAEDLRKRGVEFEIISLAVDTTTADGKLVYTVLAAFAEHERSRLSERTKEGLRAAVKRGSKLGRKPTLSNRQVLSAKQKLESKQMSLNEVAALYGVNVSTISRSIKRLETIKNLDY